jgi:hypothetical protein
MYAQTCVKCLCMELDLPRTLAAVETELENLVRARAELDRRIAGLRLAIQGLRQTQGLSAPAGLEPEGLTDSCRTVLRSAGQPLSVPQVKEQLDTMSFDWSSYSSPISALHTILKRLVNRGQAVATEAEGKVQYCWKQVRVLVAREEDINDPARLDDLIRQIRSQCTQDSVPSTVKELGTSATASATSGLAKGMRKEEK